MGEGTDGDPDDKLLALETIVRRALAQARLTDDSATVGQLEKIAKELYARRRPN